VEFGMMKLLSIKFGGFSFLPYICNYKKQNEMEYKAILFHPEGDSVTDFKGRKTKQDVWDELENMGSRWIFYPLAFVATDKRIVDTPSGLEFLKGKKPANISKFLNNEWKLRADEICKGISGGIPLSHIYPY